MSGKEQSEYRWWGALRHGGILLSPACLRRFFPETPADPLAWSVHERLRRDLLRFESGPAENAGGLVVTVLDKVCGLGSVIGGRWAKGPQVDKEWSRLSLTGEALKPRFLWQGPHGACLPVFFDAEKKLGIGRGRRSVTRVVEWLRATDGKLALITNGWQWRLVHAGQDHHAWAEWDITLWFEEGRTGPQLDALRILINPGTLIPKHDGAPPLLLEAIQRSRAGQAEVSAVLGERVRKAVETLIRAHAPYLDNLPPGVERQDVYRAATRLVMRMVVILFAEARELLPRSESVYRDSYSLNGLREDLERAGGATADRLRNRYGVWPRVLALFRLLYHGSYHPQLIVQKYGGTLFAPGEPTGADGLKLALNLFETACFEGTHRIVPDAVVCRMLQYLTRSAVKVRQGNRSTWVEAPVDFSDLSSEYIGILYEGLLDYELRQAEPGNPVVFLNVGDEPALPLRRLEQIDDSDMPNLFKTFSQKQRLATGEEDGEDEETATEVVADEAAATGEEEGGLAEPPEPVAEDARQQARAEALAWARRAVVAAKLIGKPRSKQKDAQAAFAAEVEKAASRV